jgi:hypothetical protein
MKKSSFCSMMIVHFCIVESERTKCCDVRTHGQSESRNAELAAHVYDATVAVIQVAFVARSR